MTYYVYILSSKKNGVLYVGVTNNVVKRIYEHKQGMSDGFTKKYFIKRLVYYEETPNVRSALQRGKQLKNWRREWKIALIEKNNPDWVDLYDSLV